MLASEGVLMFVFWRVLGSALRLLEDRTNTDEVGLIRQQIQSSSVWLGLFFI